jgi:DNA mismatch endonuclease (patch repair protein)
MRPGGECHRDGGEALRGKYLPVWSAAVRRPNNAFQTEEGQGELTGDAATGLQGDNGISDAVTDFLTKLERSRLMSRIRGRGTKCELALARILRRGGIKYRSQVKRLPGRPDFALVDRKVAIFVNGGFWHGRNLDLGRLAPFWRDKIVGNMRRDRRVQRALRRAGWSVVNLWDKDVTKNPEACLRRVRVAARRSMKA